MTKLFSIKEKFSKKIYDKDKLVEFRRQNINIKDNEICLIYTTSPIKKITGYFVVKKKIRASLNQLWELTKNIAGISFSEFKDYFKNCLEGTAIVFKKAKEFSSKISLEELQKKFNGFRPPQSYYNLNDDFIKIYLRYISKNEKLILFSNV
ncbi:MAG: hypothetical protein ACOC3Z_01715 [Nanoarchaeota archaeon]